MARQTAGRRRRPGQGSNGKQSAAAASRRQGEDGRRPPTREALTNAYRDATRTAMRCGLLGALGFGVTLLMLGLVAQGPGPVNEGMALEHLLAAGGAMGGVMFTVMAARASKTARSCQQRLEQMK